MKEFRWRIAKIVVLFRSPLRSVFLAGAIAAGVWALLTIKLETELLPILPQTAPSVRGLLEFARLSAGEDEIYAVVNPDLQKEERERLLAAAKPVLSEVPGIGQVAAPGEIAQKHFGALGAWMLANAPPEVFQRAAASFAPEAAADKLEQITSRLAGAIDTEEIFRLQLDPLGVLESIGSDSGATLPMQTAGFLAVTPDHPLNNTEADTATVGALRSALDKGLKQEDAHKILLTGNPVFNAEISQQMRADMLVMVGAAILLLIGAFYAFYRTLRPLRWILFFQLISILCGIVFAKIIYGELNVISIGFASILLGVGMDYSVLVYHYCASSHRENKMVWRTLRRGIWFSAAVTACSFFVLGFSSFPALRQLSVLVGVGLLTTALMATWLLRAVLTANPPTAPGILSLASESAASWVLRNKGLLLGTIIGVLGLAMAFVLPRGGLGGLYQSNMDVLRPVGSSAYRAQEWLTKADPSSSDAVYIVRGPSYDAIRDTAELLKCSVGRNDQNNINWFIPSEKNFEENVAAWSAGTAEHLRSAFKKAGVGEEWAGLTLELATALDAAKDGRIETFDSLKPILKNFVGSDGGDKFAIVRVPHAAEHPVPEGGFSGTAPGIQISPVSWVSLCIELTDLAQKDFKYLGLAMLAAIIVLCAWAQRSLRMVLLNLAGLLLALGIFAGLLAATGLSLTPLSLVSIPLLIGLVIDYSLHVLMALGDHSSDLRKTYDHLAAPVVLTGLSACIGFGAPALTGQPAMQNFGLVMDLGVVSAVLSCLVFLPAIYLLGAQKDYRQRRFYRALYRRRSFELILFGWKALGKRGAYLISRTIGLLYALTHPSTVRTVRRNMAMLDPTKAGFSAACRLLINQSENFSAYGRLARDEPGKVLRMLGKTTGFEHLVRAENEGRGCMLVTGHLGFFELGGLVLAQMGYKVAALTLPEPGDGLTEWRSDFRARWGVQTIVIGRESFAVLDAVRALQAGTFVASLADRPYDENSLDIPLPHGSMKFATGPVLLALLAGSPIVPVSIVREPGGTYRLEALAYIEPRWLPEGRAETLRHFTSLVAASLVPVFSEWSEQWFQFSPVDAAPIAQRS